jgi:H/ACA ribonucleoprotein complex subunit 4
MAALVKKQKVAEEEEQVIKPEHITPSVDTSNWALLLKNWDQREIFS